MAVVKKRNSEVNLNTLDHYDYGDGILGNDDRNTSPGSRRQQLRIVLFCKSWGCSVDGITCG